MLAHFSQFLRILGALWTHLTPAWFFGTLFFDFFRFLVDFGWISGRFWHGFWMVFRTLAKNRDFVKIVVFPWENCYFQGVELAKINQKSSQKPCKFPYGKIRSKKKLKKWIWDGFGSHLGRGWEALGRLLVYLGRFLAMSGAFNIELL